MLLGTIVYAFVNSIILALMAIGFNLTFGISGVANFAYGALYIFSAYATWMGLNLVGMPYPVAAVVSILLTMLAGALMYRFILLRVRGQALSEVIATFGIGLAILEIFRYLGFVGFEYNLPVFVDDSVVLAGVYIDVQRLLIVIIGSVVILGSVVVYPPYPSGTRLPGNRSGRTHRLDPRHRFRSDRSAERVDRCRPGRIGRHRHHPTGQHRPG